MILPLQRRLMPAALALLAAAELSAGAVGLATQGSGSPRPGSAAGVNAAGPGPGGVSARDAAGSRGFGPAHGGGAGATRSGAPASPASADPGWSAAGGPPGASNPEDPTNSASNPADPTSSTSGPGATSGAGTSAAGPDADAGRSSGHPVDCQTDLSLEQSPDVGYGFLCQAGGAPLTWAKSTLAVYVQGLSPAQSAALDTALPQWEQAARFGVTYTTRRGDADVVIASSPLGSGQPGYTEDGYTTVSYRCSPLCVYYHANLTLSSTASLSSADWISTVLHELGHVAGLNHVSRTGEVMYPYLTEDSPVLYTPGDSQGLDILAAERGA